MINVQLPLNCNFAKKYPMDEILKYFPWLTQTQIAQFSALDKLYNDWNEKINVISRKDISNLYSHHILHSLSIAKFINPIPGTRFIDLGTGGGFPGIPLAIVWPECTLHLIDRIGKKITVAKNIADAIGLTNISFQHGDIAECKEKFDFCVSRAVMEMDALLKCVKKNITRESLNSYPNGLICLKGGDLNEELNKINLPYIEISLNEYFSEHYFSTKKLIYVDMY